MKTWYEHARLREGFRRVVYKDHLGNPTAGIGHLLTTHENKKYKIGSSVSEEQIQMWFKLDTEKAEQAALKQSKEIGIEEDWFIAALISVNFQLGVKWTQVFYNTYPAIVAHNFDTAIYNLRQSDWYKQTPVRVEDFIKALERARDFKKRPLTKTRTITGAGVASIGAVSSEVVTEITQQIEPIADHSETLRLIFVILTLIGVGLVVYARLDDRKKGLR